MGKISLKSSRLLIQVGPGSTQPESTRPDVFYIQLHVYDIHVGFCIIFQTKSKINIKHILTNISIKLLIDRVEGELTT